VARAGFVHDRTGALAHPAVAVELQRLHLVAVPGHSLEKGEVGARHRDELIQPVAGKIARRRWGTQPKTSP
jgi:hypothetical protein